MSRVSTATIHFRVKRSKSNSVGDNPIYITVCFNGRREKSTGIFIPIKYWDEKNELIKGKYPNAPVFNKMLYDIKNRVLSRKLSFEGRGMKYTASMLLDDSVYDFDASSDVFIDIMRSMYKDRCLGVGTVSNYEYSYRKLCKYFGRGNFLITDLSEGVVKKIIKWCQVNGLCDGTINSLLGRIASVQNYAIENGIMDSSCYAFNRFHYCGKVKKSVRNGYIDKRNLLKIEEFFLNLVIERNGSMWHYREGVIEKLQHRTSLEFGLALCLVMLRLNGSAMVDVSLLRLKDVNIKNIEGSLYYFIDFKRKKTGMPVKVRLKDDILNQVILKLFMGFAHTRNSYIYPIKTFIGDDDKRLRYNLHDVAYKCCPKVKEFFKLINKHTIMENVKNGTEYPLIDADNFTYYWIRHSYAQAYLSSPNANVATLASLLARSPNTISTYITQLQSDKEIIDAVDNIGI